MAEERKLALIYEVDQAAVRRASKVTDDLAGFVAQIERNERDMAAAVSDSARELRESATVTRDSVREVRERVDALQTAVAVENDLTEAQLRRARSQAQADKSGGSRFDVADEFNSGVRQRSGALGDVDTALSTLGAGQAAEIFAVAEAIPNLVGSLKAVPASVEAITAAYNLQGGALTSNLLPGLAAGTTSLGAVAAVAAPVAIALAGVAIAFKEFNRQVQAGKERLEAALDTNLEANRLLIEGDRAAIEVKLEDLEIQQQAIDATREELALRKEELTLIQRLVGGRIINKELNELQQQSNITADTINTLTDKMEELPPATDDVTESLGQGTDALSDLTEQMEAIGKSSEDLDGAISSAAKGSSQWADGLNTLEREQQKNTKATEQAGDTLIESTMKISEITGLLVDEFVEFEDKGTTSVEIMTDLSDAFKRMGTFASDLISISEGSGITLIGGNEVTEEEKKLKKRRKDLLEDLADAEEDYQQRQADLLEEKQKRIADIEQEYSDSLQDAELKRDANIFFQAQKRRQEALEDTEEGYQDSLERIKDAFENVREAILEKLAEIAGDLGGAGGGGGALGGRASGSSGSSPFQRSSSSSSPFSNPSGGPSSRGPTTVTQTFYQTINADDPQSAQRVVEEVARAFIGALNEEAA